MKISIRTRSNPTITFTYRSRCNSTIPDLPRRNFGLSTARPQVVSFLSSQIRPVHPETTGPNREDTPANPHPQLQNCKRQSETKPPGNAR